MDIADLGKQLVYRKQRLSVVESCTGGLLAGLCTELAGSSQWFEGGVVTYSNALKEALGVEHETLVAHGAVSEPVVREMALSGREFCGTEWSIAISGVAGPDGGTPDKPVGTVCFAWAGPENCITQTRHLVGNRQQIREQAVEIAVQTLLWTVMA